jgi:hypothetical protein
MAPKPKAREALDAYGIDAVCRDIADGVSVKEIAAKAGASFGTMSVWLHSDPDRSARATEARRHTARLWDEQAEAEIKAATDPFEVARARELASHYRWRAKMVDPSRYGDKQQHELTGKDGGPIQFASTAVADLNALLEGNRPSDQAPSGDVQS